MNTLATSVARAAAVQPGEASRSEQAQFYAARFYVTFRCNSRCGYCNVWQDGKFKGPRELELDQAKRVLDQLHALGVRYVDVTGGEPTLHKSIVGIVQYAKSLGMVVEITTNGNGINTHLQEIVGAADIVNVSFDTLDREKYRAIRGIDGVEKMVATVQRIQTTGKRNLKLIAVITQQNLDELSNLVSFAEAIRVPINLSTMFLYFSNQGTARRVDAPGKRSLAAGQDPLPTAMEQRRQEQVNAVIAHRLISYLHRPFTQVNLHFMKRTGTIGPESAIECGANKQILTIGPDGRVMLPCYHAYSDSLPWGGDLRAAVNNPEFCRVRDHDVGRLGACKSCHVFPYIGIPFSYHFDKRFFYQAISEEIIKFKTGFLNPAYPDVVPNDPDLPLLYAELAWIVDDGLPTVPRANLFYPYSRHNGALSSALIAGTLNLADVIADNLHPYCWDIVHSPHYVIRQFYRSVLPTLKRLAADHVVAHEDYNDVLSKLYRFHLQWWIWFIGRYFRCVVPIELDPLAESILCFLRLVRSVLPEGTGGGELFLAAAVLGCRPNELRFFAADLPSGFDGKIAAARYLWRNLPPQEFADAIRLFPRRLHERLCAPLLSVAPAHEAATAIARQLGDEASAPSYVRQLAASRKTLFDVLDHSVLLDRSAVETLITALRRTADGTTRGKLCRWLSDYALSRSIASEASKE